MKLLYPGASAAEGIPAIHHVFITHSHMDHFYPDELQMRRPDFVAAEHGGKTILYAHDAGIFPEPVWAYLSETGPRFNLVSLDFP